MDAHVFKVYNIRRRLEIVDLTFLEGSVVTYMKLPEVRVLGQRTVQAVSRFYC